MLTRHIDGSEFRPVIRAKVGGHTQMAIRVMIRVLTINNINEQRNVHSKWGSANETWPGISLAKAPFKAVPSLIFTNKKLESLRNRNRLTLVPM